jgi:hypothetical protein
VSAERERERDRAVEVRAGNVADRVDHRHDYEPERECDPDVAELVRLGVDHDRPAAGEDEREGADELGREQARETHAQLGSSSASPSSTCDSAM